MRGWKLGLVGALALGGWREPGLAQTPVPAEGNVVVSTRFLAPLTYEAVLARLGTYYEEQVGRGLGTAFPEIAPGRHYEVWHDIWAFFETRGGQTMVTLKRPTEGIAGRLVKSWMLDVAGRLDAAIPLTFQEEPPLHKAEGEIYASRSDLARALVSETSMKAVATWQHAGLVVSATPLAWVELTLAERRGMHRVTVAAESPALARQLLAKVMQGVLQPGICAVYSEEAELDQEVHNLAGGQSAVAGATASVYIPNVDEKHMEDRVRAEPEMVRRSSAAQGQYDIRFRVGRSYRQVTVRWLSLSGYVRATGKYEGEQAVGQSAVSSPKLSPPAADPPTVRTRLPALKPGAYRVRLEGEDSAGQSTRIDERTYWFDGKTFEEL